MLAASSAWAMLLCHIIGLAICYYTVSPHTLTKHGCATGLGCKPIILTHQWLRREIPHHSGQTQPLTCHHLPSGMDRGVMGRQITANDQLKERLFFSLDFRLLSFRPLLPQLVPAGSIRVALWGSVQIQASSFHREACRLPLWIIYVVGSKSSSNGSFLAPSPNVLGREDKKN